MIAHLTGHLISKTTQSVIIDAGGVGYEVLVPLSTFYALPDETERVSLHIHNHVREDAFLLFGFSTRLEKDVFLMLISISGIGPKLAVNILSGIGPEDLLSAVARGDAARVQAVPGVGKKTAERIALELKDKAAQLIGEDQVVRDAPPEETGIADDAMSALLNLGYSAKAARKAIDKARAAGEEKTLETLIRKALRILA
jgi:Holliday junction DNA helicase RuvA